MAVCRLAHHVRDRLEVLDLGTSMVCDSFDPSGELCCHLPRFRRVRTLVLADAGLRDEHDEEEGGWVGDSDEDGSSSSLSGSSSEDGDSLSESDADDGPDVPLHGPGQGQGQVGQLGGGGRGGQGGEEGAWLGGAAWGGDGEDVWGQLEGAGVHAAAEAQMEELGWEHGGEEGAGPQRPAPSARFVAFLGSLPPSLEQLRFRSVLYKPARTMPRQAWHAQGGHRRTGRQGPGCTVGLGH